MARRRRKGNRGRLIPLAGLALVAVVVFTAVFALANTILGVNPPALGQLGYTITPDALKPSACAAITVTNLIASNNDVDGTAANDLILGGPATQTIYGEGGEDCILGGGSGATGPQSNIYGDSLSGEPTPATYDVCLSPTGARVKYHNCEG